MSTKNASKGLAVRTSVKAGVTSNDFNFTKPVDKSSPSNHNQTGISVRTKVKAGRISTNHNQTAFQAA